MKEEECTEEQKRELKRLQDACAVLSSHFDTIQIFTSRHTPHDQDLSGTRTVTWGIGNWYARYGQVRKWVMEEDNKTE